MVGIRRYVAINGEWAMQRPKLRQWLDQLASQVEQSLPVDRRFYVAIALVFGLVGYLAGVALVSRFAPEPISLEEPQLPPVEGGANPVLAGEDDQQQGNDPAAAKPDASESQAAPKTAVPALNPGEVRDRSEFTKAENCRIWKRTFPELAAKLKPGDSCY